MLALQVCCASAKWMGNGKASLLAHASGTFQMMTEAEFRLPGNPHHRDTSVSPFDFLRTTRLNSAASSGTLRFLRPSKPILQIPFKGGGAIPPTIPETSFPCISTVLGESASAPSPACFKLVFHRSVPRGHTIPCASRAFSVNGSPPGRCARTAPPCHRAPPCPKAPARSASRRPPAGAATPACRSPRAAHPLHPDRHLPHHR